MSRFANIRAPTVIGSAMLTYARLFDAGEDSPASMHPITGAFTDHTHTTDFETKAFRHMAGVHVALIGLMAVSDTFLAISTPSDATSVFTLHVVYASLDVMGLVIRAWLHRMSDFARAQHVGSVIWSTLNVMDAALYLMSFTDPRSACEGLSLEDTSDLLMTPLWMLVYASVNATFGLRFWHKSGLIMLCLCLWVLPGALTCHARTTSALCGGALVLGYLGTHVAEMFARHGYLYTERLKARSERLEWQHQMATTHSEAPSAWPSPYTYVGLAAQQQAAPSHDAATSGYLHPAVRYATGECNNETVCACQDDATIVRTASASAPSPSTENFAACPGILEGHVTLPGMSAVSSNSDLTSSVADRDASTQSQRERHVDVLMEQLRIQYGHLDAPTFQRMLPNLRKGMGLDAEESVATSTAEEEIASDTSGAASVTHHLAGAPPPRVP